MKRRKNKTKNKQTVLLKIPNKINICGAVWRIKLVDKLDGNHGECSSETRIIKIRKNKKNLSVMEDALFHEIQHAIVFTLSSSEYNWEKEIKPLSVGLRDVVKTFQKLK